MNNAPMTVVPISALIGFILATSDLFIIPFVMGLFTIAVIFLLMVLRSLLS